MAWSGSGSGSGSGSASGGAAGKTGGHGGGGGGGGWGGAAAIARQAANEWQLTLYAASICGLMGIFVILHWSRRIFGRASHSSCSSVPLAAPFGAISRCLRSALIRKVPRFNSAGHALVVAAYVGINAALCFTNIDLSNASNFAARAGWMTAGNLALVVFLALKNTPLAFLTAYSYERLNCLHQIAGCTMFLFMAMHATTYTVYFSKKNLLYLLVQKEQIAAIISGFAFLSVTLSAIILRRIWYELFYVVHLIFVIVGIVCVCFHQPDFKKKIIIILLLTASMWVMDRLIRIARALYYIPNNSATIYPLPNGGTRVVMKKSPTRAVPGKHFFVCIPAVRMFEMHPFTVVGTQPLEFIINSHNGFTRDLHKFAQTHPGAKLPATVDGPYGTFPDPMEYDRVVLIAGGSGASFTFGLVCNMLERMTETSNKSIVFIWAVRQHESLTWFTQQLETLCSQDHAGRVNISLYVTRAPVSPAGRLHPAGDGAADGAADGAGDGYDDRTHTMSSSSSSGDNSPIASTPDVEKALAQAGIALPPIVRHRSTLSDDIEKEMGEQLHMTEDPTSKAAGTATTEITATPAIKEVEENGQAHPHVTAGRPDAATLIREVVNSTPPNQRVLIAACGPAGLMKITRDTTAAVIQANGPAVELHCEQFSW